MTEEQFKFNISLSVLNHLGRGLYRNFATVLGEAISNSWDADAENIYIEIGKGTKDKEIQYFAIKDDGHGMTKEDMQGKFLKVGYSKRNNGVTKTKKRRPFIGNKGIGKLALLSCAEKIHVISKTTKDSEYCKVTIDNTKIDKDIKEDKNSEEHKLGTPEMSIFSKYIDGHNQGTIITFENLKRSIKFSEEAIRKILALSFKFSLTDEDFNIYVNGSLITNNDLKGLIDNTQFVWVLPETKDPYIEALRESGNLEKKNILKFKPDKNFIASDDIPKGLQPKDLVIKGFIASVKQPSHLKVRGLDQNVSLDLFVHGRLREENILKHIPGNRIYENYIYGQIHFDAMDEGEMDEGENEDRFTSDRSNVIEGDPLMKGLLKYLKEIMKEVASDWDDFRLENHEEGDPDNKNSKITNEERAARSAINPVVKKYEKYFSKKEINKIREKGKYNSPAYINCFVAENLLRSHIEERNIALDSEKETPSEKILKMKKNEQTQKEKSGLSIDIRMHDTQNLSFLDMYDLVKVIDCLEINSTIASDCLYAYGVKYRPLRNALMHTAMLTPEAIEELKALYNNIEARIIKIRKEEKKKKKDALFQ